MASRAKRKRAQRRAKAPRGARNRALAGSRTRLLIGGIAVLIAGLLAFAIVQGIREAGGGSDFSFQVYQGGEVRHFARFAFCKEDASLDEALERLSKHFGG